MTSIRKTTGNLLNVVGGEMLLRVANVFVAILIGRVYGAAILGVYASIIAVAALAERLADNGMEMAGITEASRNPGNRGGIATALYINKTALSALALILLAGFAWIAGLSRTYWFVAAILTLRTFLYSYCRLHAGLLKALDNTADLARLQAVHSALIFCCVLLVYLRPQSLISLLLYLLTGQCFEYLFSLGILYRHGLRPARVSAQFCWSLLHRSTPIGLTYSLSALMLRGDVLVLSLLASAVVVGNFAAADTGLVMVYVLAWLFSGVLLAELSRLTRDSEQFEVYFRKCIFAVNWIAVPLSLAAIILVPSAIRLFFGAKFAPAGLPGAVMAAAVPFIILNAAYLSRAIARNASRVYLGIYATSAVLSLALNFLLGHWYGAVGIAIAIVLREAAMTLAFFWIGDFPMSTEKSVVCVPGATEFSELLNA